MMKLFLESNALSSCPLTFKEMRVLASRTFRNSGFLFSQKKIVFSVAFVSSAVIRNLNRKYRQRDQVTDILSFGEYANSGMLKKEKRADIFLGELIICCSVIKESARLNGVSFRKEFGYIFAHGVLHLLGFKHGKEMFAIQDKVANKLK